MEKCEIKFRVWDKKYKRFIDHNHHKSSVMLYDNTLVVSTGYDGEDNPIWDFSKVEIDRYDFLQFTGLVDKNGNMIYEGDILKNDIFKIGKIERKIYEMWDDFSGFETWCFAGSAININRKRIAYEVEIIGNIHENPEILEKPIT